ncbi:MAG: glycoside hydrolase family 38 C-terminal domain-containing protein [candidate division Zixibacteria bacterium]|jgi:alpha-mannosidase|nr:glycoside hydrolase family 38 C-terminal domain-containing protein [candidate division Zixibacteria bacterium]
MRTGTVLAVIMCLALSGVAGAQSPAGKQSKKKLGVVATAHLDTQWRWTIKNTIEEYIPNTLHDNFALLDLYPDYIFSFEGAFRYMLAQEYYPDDYERLRGYIADGRWRVTGSWVDAVDVNIPSFESLVRHALYGNGFYKREFGKQSYDIFMPDCFGFGYALPSIANHCGLKSFSTQKLTWGCSVPVPFSIGHWRGVDGSSVVAGLKTGNYVATFRDDLSRDTAWGAVIDELGDSGGCYAGYIYFGTGDVGGAPDSLSVDWLVRSIHSDGPLTVASIGADDLPALINEFPGATLPEYDGELVMTRHGVGCYTSQAAMKRWNRKNELLADAAERAAVTATLLGGYAYPKRILHDAWVRFLWHQFHDDLTGTSIPEAYEFSWSDELLSLNQFAGVLTSSVAAIAPALDTRGEGHTYVVYNPLSIERSDVVEIPLARESLPHGFVRVFGPDGAEVPSQVVMGDDGPASVLVRADVPPVGLAIYDVRSTESGYEQEGGVTATPAGLESERYRLTLNADGDVASIFDKKAGREMLAAPIEWQLIFNKPRQWPAWEIQYEDLLAGPRGKVEGTPSIEVLESGSVRGAIKITRTHGGSEYQTIIRLAAQDDRIDFVNTVNWAEKETLLKVAFKPAFANDTVTYDLGLGTIARGINTEKKYEVPGHQWADISSRDGSYGLTVMNDCRYGWDHPDSGTLRLTLIHTPGVFDSWSWVGDQSSQDLGIHHFTFSLAGHERTWRESGAVWQAARLNQPLIAFSVPQHPGKLGKSHSLLAVGGDGQVMVNAVKMAENSDEVIVRVRELAGRPAEHATITFGRPVVSVREVNGQEEEIGAATADRNEIGFSLSPYQPKAFAVRLGQPRMLMVEGRISQPIELPYDLDGISLDENPTDGNLDGDGNTLAGELLPDRLEYDNVQFAFGPTSPGAANVVTCTGQELTLPSSPESSQWSDVYLLMLATGGPAEGEVTVVTDGGSRRQTVSLYEYTEPVGQWDNRMVNGRMVSDRSQIVPAYINQTPVAWAGTHRHTAAGKNDIYKFTYVYGYRVPLAADARAIILPDNPGIKLMAASVAGPQHDAVRAVTPLYDAASTNIARIAASDPIFIDSTIVTLSSPMPGTVVRYTLDGGEPDGSSPVFAGPVRLSESTTIKARAFGPRESGVTSTFAVQKLIPRAAVPLDDPSAGLLCSYYEGEWQRLPDFSTLTPVSEFVTNTVAIPESARPEDYALVFRGFVQVPVDGLYEFGISSDDGSALWVADTLIADNDGIHGDGEIAGKIALTAGYHPIEARMFQCKGGQALRVLVTGPGIDKQEVGKSMLFHQWKETR